MTIVIGGRLEMLQIHENQSNDLKGHYSNKYKD